MYKEWESDAMLRLTEKLSRANTSSEILEVTREETIRATRERVSDVNLLLVNEAILSHRDTQGFHQGPGADFYKRAFSKEVEEGLIRVSDLASEREPYLQTMSSQGAKSLLALPVSDKGRLVWILEMLSQKDDSLSDPDISRMKSVANIVSLALARERQRHKVEVRERQVEKLFEISQETDTARLLDRVVKETPDLIKGGGCSIFLLPALLPTEDALSPTVRKMSEPEKNMTVVLAASFGLPKKGVGRYFYRFGKEVPPRERGLTGWVALTGASINVKDITDSDELERVARRRCSETGSPFVSVEWRARYNECNLDKSTARPFLAVPIISPKTSRVIGVLRMDAREPTENFSDNDEKIFRSFAGFLAGRLEAEYWTRTLDKALRSQTPMELGDVLLGGAAVVFAPQAAVRSSELSIFLVKEGEKGKISLGASTSIDRQEWGSTYYKVAEPGCTPWVFSTGRSLLVNNIQDSEELERAREKSGESRPLKWSGKPEKCEIPDPGPFMCAPIRSKEDEILGAIRVVRSSGEDRFSVDDFQRLGAYAERMSSIVQLYIDREQKQLERSIRRSYKILNGLSPRGPELEIYRRHLHTEGFGNVIGTSKIMLEIYELVAKIIAEGADRNGPLTVLLKGESGTGKSFIADLLHKLSRRKKKPFIVCPCTDIAPSMLESGLFGHEKGSFTGALDRHRGLFEQADGGTIVLDNIQEIDLSAQAKLLRVIEEKRIRRLGGEKEIKLDVWVIAATTEDLLEKVRKREFNEGLYFRLKCLTIDLPPLRERKKDIPLLVRHYLERWRNEKARKRRHVRPTQKAWRLLDEYHWPGNVRELFQALEASLVSNSGGASLNDSIIRRHLERRETAAGTSISNAGVLQESRECRVNRLLEELGLHTQLEDSAKAALRNHFKNNDKISPKQYRLLTGAKNSTTPGRHLSDLVGKGIVEKESNGVYCIS